MSGGGNEEWAVVAVAVTCMYVRSSCLKRQMRSFSMRTMSPSILATCDGSAWHPPRPPLLAARRVAAVERLPRFGPLRLRLRHRLKRRRDELVGVDLAVLPHEERPRVVARAAVVGGREDRDALAVVEHLVAVAVRRHLEAVMRAVEEEVMRVVVVCGRPTAPGASGRGAAAGSDGGTRG